MPIAMQPLPGTVVKVCAASIVRLMYCRFSTAPESIGVGPVSRGRFGVALIVVLKVAAPSFLSSTLHHKVRPVREPLRRTDSSFSRGRRVWRPGRALVAAALAFRNSVGDGE